MVLRPGVVYVCFSVSSGLVVGPGTSQVLCLLMEALLVHAGRFNGYQWLSFTI